MTAAPVQIVGFTTTNKVPGFYGEVRYGVGARSASDLPTSVLVVGYKLAAGLAVADQDVIDIRSSEDADLYFGAGSEVARMCYKALLVPGVTLKASAIANPPNAVAATATITIGGGWSTTGSWSYRIDGETISGGVLTTDTPASVATAIVTAIMANPRLPVTATSNLGAVTLTRKQVGQRGNLGSIFQDTTRLPTGLISTLASTGAGAGAIAGGGVRFGGGSAPEVPALTIANLFSGHYNYVALATSDISVINAGASWRDTFDQKAGATENRASFVVTGWVGDASTAATFASTVNDVYWQCAWLQDAECTPGEIAARVAAERQVAEQQDPAKSYDGRALSGLPAQSSRASRPSRATQEMVLNSGVTPLTTTGDGRVVIVRAITTRCVTNNQPDYRTLDVAQAVVPEFIRQDLALLWEAFKEANPRVADDPPSGGTRPAGIGTPALWNARVTALLLGHEAGFNGGPPILIDVQQHLPTSGYQKVAGGGNIMTAAPVVPAPSQHSVGVSIQQVSGLSA